MQRAAVGRCGEEADWRIMIDPFAQLDRVAQHDVSGMGRYGETSSSCAALLALGAIVQAAVGVAAQFSRGFQTRASATRSARKLVDSWHEIAVLSWWWTPHWSDYRPLRFGLRRIWALLAVYEPGCGQSCAHVFCCLGAAR